MGQFFFTPNQIIAMSPLQDALNEIVNPNWKNLTWDYPLASEKEAYEAIDHVGWKWWKHQVIDKPQVKLELVDIAHFALSHWLRDTVWNGLGNKHEDFQENIELMAVSLSQRMECNGGETGVVLAVTEEDLKSALIYNFRLLARRSADPGEVFCNLSKMMYLLGFTASDLVTQYIGKNTLNIFRQDNGYKDGTYIKIWDGREDNEVLTDIMNSITGQDKDDPIIFAQLVREKLTEAYALVS